MDPGLQGTLVDAGDDDVVIETGDGDRLTVTRSVAETVSVVARGGGPLLWMRGDYVNYRRYRTAITRSGAVSACRSRRGRRSRGRA
jgi:hypothetical protein